MSVEIQGKVGPTIAADGVLQTLRMTKDGALVGQDLHARFYETASRGKVFSASIGVAGVTPGLSLTTTPPITLYNPANSGVNAVILASSFGYISGTLPAGTIVYGFGAQATAPTGGTALTVRSGLIGSAAAAACLAFTGATLLQAPAILRPAFVMSAFLATTATAPTPPVFDPIDGKFILTPGFTLSMQGVAVTGSTPLVLLALEWEEVTP